MPTIELGSRKIEYTTLKGTSARYTYFRFRSDMTLEVILPRGGNVDLEGALRGRRSWILKQYELMSRDERVLDRERVMFEGEYLRIVFVEDTEKEDLQLDRANRQVIIRSSDRARVRELVRRLFLRETSKDVIDTLARVSHQFPKYSRADVREMRNWGYCTRSGRLSFSWQLIALPAASRVRDPARTDAPMRVQPLASVQAKTCRGLPRFPGKGKRVGQDRSDEELSQSKPLKALLRKGRRNR